MRARHLLSRHHSTLSHTRAPCLPTLTLRLLTTHCFHCPPSLICTAGGTLAAGMLLTLAAVVYAAVRAGSNTRLFTLEGSEDGEGGAAGGSREQVRLQVDGM